MKLSMPLFLLVMVAQNVLAQPPGANDWPIGFALKNEDAPAGFARATLTPVVVDRSLLSLGDLRILPERLEQAPREELEKSLVPFIVHTPPSGDAVVQEWLPLQVMNRVFQPGEYEQIVLDFGESVRKNQVRIELSGENFRRRVSIEGSADGQTWSMVREDGWLFDISQPHGNYEVTIVDFPLNDFRYLRVMVYQMADDARRIDIKKVSILHYEVPEVESIPVPIEILSRNVDDETRATDIVVDVQYRNLPIWKISLATDAPYFYRAYELSGRNQAIDRIERPTETGWDPAERESPWIPVASGVLYRIQEGNEVEEKTIIEHAAPYRYLRLRIHNGDNPPLEVNDVAVERRALPSLVFANEPDQGLVLLCGNTAASPPRFDLAQSVRELKVAALPEVAIADTPRPRVVTMEVPWTARNGWVIWLALAVAVAAVGGLIYANLSEVRRDMAE